VKARETVLTVAKSERASRPRGSGPAAVTTYLMDPAEDVILFGDELADGMWVLADDCCSRPPYGGSEDERLHSQRFRRVTRLRREGDLVTFIGEWLDGYQALHQAGSTSGWIVKKDSLAAGTGLAAVPRKQASQHPKHRL
jgi:hypothetical protein